MATKATPTEILTIVAVSINEELIMSAIMVKLGLNWHCLFLFILTFVSRSLKLFSPWQVTTRTLHGNSRILQMMKKSFGN